MLRLLANLSFRCHAFCGGRFDVPREVTLGEVLARRDWPFESQKVAWGGSATTIIKTMLEGTRGRQPAVPMTIFRTQSSRGQWAGQAEINAMLGAYADFLEDACPTCS